MFINQVIEDTYIKWVGLSVIVQCDQTIDNTTMVHVNCLSHVDCSIRVCNV